jgi:hypothetical protein
MKNRHKFIDSFLTGFTDPTKNFLLFFILGLIVLPITTNGISELFWTWLSDFMQVKFNIARNSVLIYTLFTLVALLLLLVYGTNFTFWLRDRLTKFLNPIGEFEPNVSEFQDTLAGLIVFGGLQPNNSPAERAINFHWRNGTGKLKHCWIICTDSSLAPVNAMVDRLNDTGGLQFYHGTYNELKDDFGNQMSLLVPQDDIDDPNYFQKLVDAIYQDANSKGLQNNEIVADYTGGTKSMTAGMVIACIDSSRQLQYYSQQNLKPENADEPPKKVAITFKIKPKS